MTIEARNVNLSMLGIGCLLLIPFNDSIAGNYGKKIQELTPIFNKAARNIEPPPPTKLEPHHRMPGGDPPGLHGPTIGTTPPPPPPPIQIKLTPK